MQRFDQIVDGHLPIFRSLHNIKLLLANVHDSAKYALCDVTENYVVELNFEGILWVVICKREFGFGALTNKSLR